jgi:hypothetical protein
MKIGFVKRYKSDLRSDLQRRGMDEIEWMADGMDG